MCGWTKVCKTEIFSIWSSILYRHILRGQYRGSHNGLNPYYRFSTHKSTQFSLFSKEQTCFWHPVVLIMTKFGYALLEEKPHAGVSIGPIDVNDSKQEGLASQPKNGIRVWGRRPNFAGQSSLTMKDNQIIKPSLNRTIKSIHRSSTQKNHSNRFTVANVSWLTWFSSSRLLCGTWSNSSRKGQSRRPSDHVLSFVVIFGGWFTIDERSDNLTEFNYSIMDLLRWIL